MPGDVHLHFFCTATVSFVDNVKAQAGDEFEIDLPALGAPLVNPLAIDPGGLRLAEVVELDVSTGITGEGQRPALLKERLETQLVLSSGL